MDAWLLSIRGLLSSSLRMHWRVSISLGTHFLNHQHFRANYTDSVHLTFSYTERLNGRENALNHQCLQESHGNDEAHLVSELVLSLKAQATFSTKDSLPPFCL